MRPKAIQKIIDLFSKFPTIASRTADRFSNYIINLSDSETDELINAIKEVRMKIKSCFFCFSHFEVTKKNNKFCEICSNNLRNKDTLCIVEKEADLRAIEQTKKYKGIYFVLGKNISPLKKENILKTRIKDLLQRIQKNNFKEVIIATNFTADGETTAFYLESKLKDQDIKTTRLAKGLPTGGELEYIDEETILSALEGRK